MRGGNGFESRQTRWVVRGRQVIWMCGHCDGVGCACRGGKKSADKGRLRGRPSASTAVQQYYNRIIEWTCSLAL
jgi:hypothetical protein